MTDKIDPVELAYTIAEIARTTPDPETGRRLMQLVETLLGVASLPSDDSVGGGEPPCEWVSARADTIC